MRIEYINPFVESSCEIMEEVLGTTVEKEELYLKDTTTPILGVAVFIGLAGMVKGRVLIDMTDETAINIFEAMAGEKEETLSDFARSAITELANMIIGRAITKLHNLGFTFHMSPPTIVTGDNMEISSPSIEAFIVPLKTSMGRIEVNVAVKESRDE
jgi:chemotaxis protein CheX